MLMLISTARSSDAVGVATTAVVTIAVVILIAIVVIVALAVRRRRRAADVVSAPLEPVATGRASALLVRLDDAVAENDDELGFAIAQFGEDSARPFAAAVESARRQLAEAFRLKQKLDDATPDTASEQREWLARIVHLCETSLTSLETEAASFHVRRDAEATAAADLKAARFLVVSTSMRVPGADATVARLAAAYSPAVVEPARSDVVEARSQLAVAAEAAGIAEKEVADAASSTAADTVRRTQAAARRAGELLDRVDTAAASLASASATLAALAATSEADLAEGRAVRDSAELPLAEAVPESDAVPGTPAISGLASTPGAAVTSTTPGAAAVPGPQSTAAVGEAVEGLEEARSLRDVGDPEASITRLQLATAHLDSALAAARNDQQRLEHASAALAGVLVSARSQIAATSTYIENRRGAVGTDARTRLAEAQRLLTVAEGQSDPVEALDIARSSQTYSRDADALARYDSR